MNSSIIIYASRNGSTERYARYLSLKTSIPCMSYKAIKSLEEYDRVIFLGAIYAGSLVGIKSVAKKLTKNQELYIITVGMVDPADPENIRYIHERLKQQISSQYLDEDKIFHLHGRIDYSRMGIKHRIMMYFVYHKLKNMSYESLSVGERTIVDTYGKTIDSVDYNNLGPLIEKLT